MCVARGEGLGCTHSATEPSQARLCCVWCVSSLHIALGVDRDHQQAEKHRHNQPMVAKHTGELNTPP